MYHSSKARSNKQSKFVTSPCRQRLLDKQLTNRFIYNMVFILFRSPIVSSFVAGLVEQVEYKYVGDQESAFTAIIERVREDVERRRRRLIVAPSNSKASQSWLTHGKMDTPRKIRRKTAKHGTASWALYHYYHQKASPPSSSGQSSPGTMQTFSISRARVLEKSSTNA